MCKGKGFTLKWYDYNEPSQGKDQCDREAAGAKLLLRSYTDAGNDILTAEDVFKALRYVKGIQNARVACISIDTSKATLSPCTAIPKISQYHSFEFHHDHMIMWRCFGIGEGKRWNYTNISFMPTSQWCCHLAVQLLVSQKVQACRRKEEMTEPYVIYTSVLSQDVWIPSKM